MSQSFPLGAKVRFTQERLSVLTARDQLVATDPCLGLRDAAAMDRLLAALAGNFADGVRTP